MKTINAFILTTLFISLNVNAIPIHVRFPPAVAPVPQNHFSIGDSCLNKGRKVFLLSSAVNAPTSYVVCKKTVGKNSEINYYTLPGKVAGGDDVRQYLGCTVDSNGVATGYSVLWFSFGIYIPSDIRDASTSLVIEFNRGGTATVLQNYNTKRDIIVDYIRDDGVLISNVIIPSKIKPSPPVPFSTNRTIVRAVYSFPYGSGDIPCSY